MLATQAFGDGVVELGRRRVQLCPQRLGARFEGGEVVGAFIEEIAGFLGWQQNHAATWQRDTA